MSFCPSCGPKAVPGGNFYVSALRAQCLKYIKKYETVKVRSDLVLPRDWHSHYENLYQAQLPKLTLAVVQYAFVGDPLTGKLYELAIT